MQDCLRAPCPHLSVHPAQRTKGEDLKDAKVIDYLNAAPRSELTAVGQYWLHDRLQEDWGFGHVTDKSRAETNEERHHADRLIARFIFLEGHPGLQKPDPLRIGQTVREALEADLTAEHDARALHRGASLLRRGRRLRHPRPVRRAAGRRGKPHRLSRDPAFALRKPWCRTLRPAQSQAGLQVRVVQGPALGRLPRSQNAASRTGSGSWHVWRHIRSPSVAA